MQVLSVKANKGSQLQSQAEKNLFVNFCLRLTISMYFLGERLKDIENRLESKSLFG